MTAGPGAYYAGLQRYGRDDSEVIWSIHRGDLNITLLDLAERAGAKLHFHRRLDRVDFDGHVARFVDDRDATAHAAGFSALVGADGAGSSLRAAMLRREDLGERTEFLDHAYKELEIPPAADGGFIMLDTATTPELEAEGVARDLVRAVQDARKATGLEVGDRIRLNLALDAAGASAAEAHRELISGETLAVELAIVAIAEDLAETVKPLAGGTRAVIGVEKA